MHKSKKPSKSRRVGRYEWSDWIWSDQYGRYYRQREGADGNFEHEWAAPAPAAPEETSPIDDATPRDPVVDGLVDSLAEGIDKLSTYDNDTSSSGYSLSPGSSVETDNTSYSYSSKGKSTKQSSSGKASRSKHHHERGKGKGVSYDEGDEDDDPPQQQPLDPFYGARTQVDSEPAPVFERPIYDDPGRGSRYPTYESPAAGYPYGDPPAETQYQEAEPPGTEGADYVETGSYSSSGHRHRSSRAHQQSGQKVHFQEGEGEFAEEQDLEFLAAIEETRRPNHGRSGGESSRDAYVPIEPEEEGQLTPKASHPSFDIRGTTGDAESLDPRYVVEHSMKFQPGEVFKVLWSEPSGAIAGTPTISDRREFRDRYGESFYVGFRRFIVIANDEGHCTCVPILTYGGKGCHKRGVKPQKHGIIHQYGHKARLLDGEPKLGFGPARMKILAEGEKLARESRVNYSKLVTVEHNVKVFFIGHIIPEDFETVFEAVNKCWEDKIHHQRKKYFK